MNIIIVFFYAIMLIYVGKLVVRIILSIVYPFKKVGNDEVYPTISVIVPAYNEEVTIANCIQSLSNLDYSKYEVIIVDDGSTDRTAEIAKRFETLKIRVVYQENQGKANALNNGILLAKGEIVVTVDTDTTRQRGA